MAMPREVWPRQEGAPRAQPRLAQLKASAAYSDPMLLDAHSMPSTPAPPPLALSTLSSLPPQPSQRTGRATYVPAPRCFTAVWDQVAEASAAAGSPVRLHFDASAMPPGQTPTFDVAAFSRRLRSRRLGRVLLAAAELGSTQEVARSYGQLLGDGVAVVADRQTAGRGALPRRNYTLLPTTFIVRLSNDCRVWPCPP